MCRVARVARYRPPLQRPRGCPLFVTRPFHGKFFMDISYVLWDFLDVCGVSINEATLLSSWSTCTYLRINCRLLEIDLLYHVWYAVLTVPQSRTEAKVLHKTRRSVGKCTAVTLHSACACALKLNTNRQTIALENKHVFRKAPQGCTCKLFLEHDYKILSLTTLWHDITPLRQFYYSYLFLVKRKNKQ